MMYESHLYDIYMIYDIQQYRPVRVFRSNEPARLGPKGTGPDRSRHEIGPNRSIPVPQTRYNRRPVFLKIVCVFFTEHSPLKYL